jgi:hypothetical protein
MLLHGIARFKYVQVTRRSFQKERVNLLGMQWLIRDSVHNFSQSIATDHATYMLQWPFSRI